MAKDAGLSPGGEDAILPSFDPEDLRIVHRFTSGQAPGSQANHRYAARALGVLNYEPRFAWLCPNREAARKGEARVKVTVLAALGRIADDRRLRAIARRICAQRLGVGEAVALARDSRLAGPRRTGPP